MVGDDMKKIKLLAILLIIIITTGCSQKRDFEMKYDGLSEEQNEILTLTGNKILKYKLKNIPNDKSYELNLIYEVYKDNEKIKEEKIISMLHEPTNEKIKDLNLAINIQENKIICLAGGAYTSFDIEENIGELSQQCFFNDVKINMEDEIYLFHGVKSENGLIISDLGYLSDEDKNNYIKNNELNIFIKLECKEIK